MTTLEKMEELLSEMNQSEKLLLIQKIAQTLQDDPTGIISSPEILGGEPRIAGTRIPVWLLVQYQKLGAGDVDLLQMYPTLTAEDLAHAWAYYRIRRNEIENQILENENA
jgi:uncharacterized protein (DUF433 family)